MNKVAVLRISFWAALAFAVAGAPEPRQKDTFVSRDASLTEDYKVGINNLLVPYCKNDHTCNVLVFFASSFCAVPNQSGICQSDCKFLLRYLWDQTLVHHQPNIEELRKFVPDDCTPITIISNEPSKQTPPMNDAQVHQYVQEAETNNSLRTLSGLHDDKMSEEIIAKLNTASQLSSWNVTCVLPQLKGGQPTLLQPGQITSKPCKEEYPYETGDILGVCLETGYLYYSIHQCEVNYEEWEKEVYEYAKSMNAITTYANFDPKKALNDGETFLKGVADFLKKDKVKEFLPIAENIASFLGPVGIAFKIIAFALPTTDPKHDAIMTEFKKMEEKTMEIKNAIERLPIVFRKEFFKARIEEIKSTLTFMEEQIDMLSIINDDALLEDIRSRCTHFPPEKFINDANHIFDRRESQFISEIYGYHRGEFSKHMAMQLLVYGVRASVAAIKCYGLRKTATESATNALAAVLQSKIKIMFNNLNYIVEEFIPINAMPRWIENDLTEWMESHKGEDNQKLASNLYSHLSTKYDFYRFAIVVYNKVSSTTRAARSTKCFRCADDQSSGMYFSDRQYDKSVMIMYSNTPMTDIESGVRNIFNFAVRNDLQYYVDYLTKGRIRNAMACRFGEALRSSIDGWVSKFYNIQSISTIVTF